MKRALYWRSGLQKNQKNIKNIKKEFHKRRGTVNSGQKEKQTKKPGFSSLTPVRERCIGLLPKNTDLEEAGKGQKAVLALDSICTQGTHTLQLTHTHNHTTHA